MSEHLWCTLDYTMSVNIVGNRKYRIMRMYK